MDTTQQLLDSLTSHIALYHQSPTPNPNPNPNPRSSILRWFSSLPIPHRQSLLTVLDPAFLQLLLDMRRRLLSNGPSLFFLLPDLPSSHSLPSLLSRRSHGLLARCQTLTVTTSLRLFSSSESPSLAGSPLDCFTLSSDLVSDVDRFVEAMDSVTGGRFLRGEQGELGEAWVEMAWLKEMGYFSLEAFVANRIEVALRLAWINSHGGRKGKKGKEKAVGVAGVAANAFWRKKGCLDWWMALDPGWRDKIFLAYLGKAAKSLANEIVEQRNICLKNEFGFLNIKADLQLRHGPSACSQKVGKSFFKRDSDFSLDNIRVSSGGIQHTLANFWNRLLVVQEVSSVLLAYRISKVDTETLFFSTIGSALTVSDCIMRKLRGLLIVVSINCINLELTGDEKLKTLISKTEVKLNGACGKGKKKCRKSKKRNTMLKKSQDSSTLPEPSADNKHRGDSMGDSGSRFSHHVNSLSVGANDKTDTVDNCMLQNNLGEEQAKRRANKKENGGKGIRSKISNSKTIAKLEVGNGNTVVSTAEENGLANSIGLTDTSTIEPVPINLAIEIGSSPLSSSYDASTEAEMMDCTRTTDTARPGQCLLTTAGSCHTDGKFSPNSENLENGATLEHVSPCLAEVENISQTASSCPAVGTSISCEEVNDSTTSCVGFASNCDISGHSLPAWEHENPVSDNQFVHQNVHIGVSTSQCVLLKPFNVLNDKGAVFLNDVNESYANSQTNSMGGVSYEWPSITPLHLAPVNSQHLPAATDRLHLDVCHKRAINHQSFVPSRHQAINSSIEGGHSRMLPSLALPMSYDLPPMVKSCNRLSQTVTISYDSAFTPALPPSFCSGFAGHAAYGNGAAMENDRKHPGDIFDMYDSQNAFESADDADNYWMSEEESEIHAFSGRDYNQFFGGGVMYWNPAEHMGSGYSRPPSHSSEDSSWVADINRAIDDMVGMPGLPASYYTNGLASPPAAPFCSPFDPLGPGHQSVGYAIQGNDGGNASHSSSSAQDVPEDDVPRSLGNLPGCVEGVKGDALPYSMLRPIIIPSSSRKGSRSELRFNHDHKSPCLPSSRREHTQIKRPPSPVVLCVPRVPRPPPPSPVGESRKRGIPIVRSGSSSPRHWGMRSWYNEDGNSEEAHLCLDGVEVVWPSWRNKGLAGTPVARTIQGSLLQDHLLTISQLARDQEHPDVALPLQPPNLLNCSNKASLSVIQNVLHEEIDFFCKQVAAENLIKKPYINWAVRRVTRSLQVLWPRSRTNIFGSNATGLALPTSDVDLVVSLPPVRNLEPIKEAGILEGRNGIKETCLQHAARYLANQEWVRNDSLKTVENTAIPVIMLVAEVPHDVNFSNGNSSIVDMQEAQSTVIPGEVGSSHTDHSNTENASLPICTKMRKDGVTDVKSIRLDISFKSSSHTGLQTSELVRELTQQFSASVPLALVLKKFLADRSLDHSYSGGLSSYCLVLLITRFLQHEHHIGRSINQNLGSLLMDFLYFFGNIFDPRQMRVSIQGMGVYLNRERGHSIDPIHIDDPLFPSNNVGRNCFRIHQCIKAFADAYSVLENELSEFSGSYDQTLMTPFRLLRKIIPSIDQEE